MMYTIYEGYMEELEKKMRKIERKCARYGGNFHYEIIGEEIREVTYGESKFNMRFVQVDVDGEAIINGWEFIGSVEHTEAGNILHKAIASVEIPERYRNSEPYCEHCGTHRRRKDTYIIRNTESGEFKQVGKTCLMDYTRGYDAKLAAEILSLRALFDGYEERDIEERFFSGGSYSYFGTEEIVTMAVEIVNKFGYAKAESDHPTKQRIMDILFKNNLFSSERKILERELEAVGYNPDTEENQQTAKDAIAWIREQDGASEYMHNLKVAASRDYINVRNIGLLVSLIPTYNKAMKIKAQREQRAAQDSKSEYVGNVGDKINVEVTGCQVVTSWESCYNGYDVSTTYLYKFTDNQDNIYIWKTAKRIACDKIKSLKGTIKEHKDYNGAKQNVVTRCRVA